ncbi:MAG: hypothetical protein DBY38_02165 [Clostridium cadaveris]|uniref:Uncharacterized protein n=1 Tax=Clostridium cadaveris TaxID=1529 RepID=A0A316MAD9_9CLOT|nr:MAG: hypothetical protein DBY38_02165 [Clostridium cadaveris]
MITIEDAYSYFYNERLFAEDWLMAEDNRQEQSLKMARNQINRLKFSKYTDDDKEDNLKKAICEQALYLIQTQNTQRSRLIEQGVTSFSVEGLSESYDVSKASKKICSEAMEYIKPYLIGCVSIC